MNTWEGFHGGFDGATQNTIIMAHDGGHLSIGTTMENQNVAAFDPIFWFFHSNWDRLFWQMATGNGCDHTAGFVDHNFGFRFR